MVCSIFYIHNKIKDNLSLFLCPQTTLVFSKRALSSSRGLLIYPLACLKAPFRLPCFSASMGDIIQSRWVICRKHSSFPPCRKPWDAVEALTGDGWKRANMLKLID